MIILLIITLIGVNLAPFIFAKLDFWHAQGFWIQSCILTIFCCSFFLKPKNKNTINIPLGLFLLWSGINTAFFCFIAQMKGKYDTQHFFPFFNILCIAILYKIIVSYMTKEDVTKIIKVMRSIIIFTLIMCVLQYFGLSQFFALVEPSSNYHNNPVVGFIANPTHLSGFLAMMLPLFMIKRSRENIFIMILMGIILLFLTGTTKGDPAISGIIVAIAVTWYFIFSFNKIKSYLLLATIVVIGIFILSLTPHHAVERLFADNGRIGWMTYYWEYFKQMPLTGAGLGFINMFYKHSEYPLMRHLHMEYFQIAFELGIVGLMLFIWMIRDFFSIDNSSREKVAMKAIVFGFLVSCCFNYPAHLWLSASYALFAYASVYVLNGDS